MVRSSCNPDWPRQGRDREPGARSRPLPAPPTPGPARRRPDKAAAKAGNQAGAVYGAIDLGTNNCRLLVARPAARGFQVVDAFSRIVRLGEGVAAHGRLSEAAIQRTLSALRVCANKMRRNGVTRSRAVATEACRRADNCTEFLQRVYHETEIELEIISAEEEARLGLHSCLPLLDEARPHALLFDIGGGSTEVSWIEIDGAKPHLRASDSLPIGVVSLTERYGGREVPAATYRSMMAEVAEALAPFEARHGLARRIAAGEVQMLGISGTVTTLTGVHKKLRRYDRGQVDGVHLSLDTVAEVSRRIVAMSYAERVANPCIGHERADLVIAGCAILEAICGLWPAGRLCVADRGLREGMLLALMAGDAAVQAILPGPRTSSS
jgi:exopolyphosphatase/guanosine-5'-triphosphate,3'-diphosphate pyrophosphatase